MVIVVLHHRFLCFQATDTSGRESSLWPGAEGEGPVQGSLLEEVLAEKRMVQNPLEDSRLSSIFP